MSLLACLVSRAGPLRVEPLKERLEAFSLSRELSGPLQPHMVVDGRAALLSLHLPDAIAQIHQQSFADVDLWTNGFFVREQAVTSQLHLSEPAGLDGSVVTLVDQLQRQEGEFVSTLLDRRNQQVHLVNDRFAQRPFFLLETPEVIAAASNLAFLLYLADVNPDPDPLGWLQIFCYGHTLGQRTHSEGVTRLRPAEHAVLSSRGITRSNYRRLSYDVQTDLDPSAHAAGVLDAFRRAGRARSTISPQGIFALSGGLDSRLLVGALSGQVAYPAMTFVDSTGSTDTPEVNAARRVARTLRMKHDVVELDNEAVSSQVRTLTRLIGGLLPVHHAGKSTTYIEKMQTRGGYMMGGGPGDVLIGGYVSSLHQLNPRLTASQVQLYARRRQRHDRTVLARLFRRDVLAATYPRLFPSMLDSFSDIEGPTAAHRISLWAMTVRQPAFTFNSPLYAHPSVTEASPHLGYDYVDLILQMPAEWLYGKAFYKFLIYTQLPALRDIPYANTGELLTGQMRQVAYPPAKAMMGFLEGLQPANWVERRRRQRASQQSTGSFELDLMRRDDKLLEDMSVRVSGSSGMGQLFDRDKTLEFLQDIKKGNTPGLNQPDTAELLGSLASACYWISQFE